MKSKTRPDDIAIDRNAVPSKRVSQGRMSEQVRDALLNNVALRSFRDIADGDYIAARMAYRVDLIPQALWASQQAIEKYVKCVLLLRRITWQARNHSLLGPLAELERQYPLRLSTDSREFIAYLDTYGTDRYFTLPYFAGGFEIISLDRLAWEIRRYCIPYTRGNTPKGTPIVELDLKHIENAENYPPQLYRSLSPGPLDAAIREASPVGAALIWKNLYFGRSARKSVKLAQRSQSANSPLALHPEILDEVGKYIHLPRAVREALMA